MIKVQVGDIVELSCLGGKFVEVGKVVEIIPFHGQNDIVVESHKVRPGELVSFSEGHVSRVISKGCERDELESIIDEITRG
jgi:hypothetical protein